MREISAWCAELVEHHEGDGKAVRFLQVGF